MASRNSLQAVAGGCKCLKDLVINIKCRVVKQDNKQCKGRKQDLITALNLITSGEVPPLVSAMETYRTKGNQFRSVK